MLLGMNDSKTIYECVFAFATKVESAMHRCEQVAAGETALGYIESAKMYREMCGELAAVKGWQHEQLKALIV